jgi:hypothetical protein
LVARPASGRSPAELRAASGGWITGAILMSMQGGCWQAPGSAPSTGGEHLFDYFAGQPSRISTTAPATAAATAFLVDVSQEAALRPHWNAEAEMARATRAAQPLTERRAGAAALPHHDLFRILRHRAGAGSAPIQGPRSHRAPAHDDHEAAQATALLLECEGPKRARRRHVEA